MLYIHGMPKAPAESDPSRADISGVRLTTKEKAYLGKAARREGAQLSTWIRMAGLRQAGAILGYPIDEADDRGEPAAPHGRRGR